MRNAMKTTPQSSYTTCILRKGKASLTPERTFWDTCSRHVWCHGTWDTLGTKAVLLMMSVDLWKLNQDMRKVDQMEKPERIAPFHGSSMGLWLETDFNE